MLEITICTKDNFLRKQFENVVTQLMNTNQIEFHLTEVKSSEEIKDNSFLILGDSDALASYHQKRMMIVVLNDHHQDKALANLALTCFIKKEDVETHLYETVSQWLDYYFENYHYNFDDVHDFFVNEIMYFKVKSFSELTAVSEDRCIDFTVKNGYEILLNSLPMNFLMVGTEYIINVDMITSIENGTATMKDGAVIDNVDENKIKDRSQRFELGVSETVAIGDKYDAKKLKKLIRNLSSLVLF